MNTVKPVVVIDSCTDLPYEYIKGHNIPVVNFTYHFKGKDNTDDFFQSIDPTIFYNRIRAGEMPTTSQVNTELYIKTFRPYLEEKRPVICLCFSSALSGSYNSCVLAKGILEEEYPNADLTIIDTKAASLGSGLIAWHAIKMLEEGASKEELVQWIETNLLKVAHWFTVNDLNHLKRGGRVSGATAFIGTMLDIKPILHVDDEGLLVPVSKVKGRKKSLRALFEKLQETIVSPEGQMIFISHGDAQEDAQYLADMIKKEYKVQDVLINHVGPVIGAHAGPGTIALFFLATGR